MFGRFRGSALWLLVALACRPAASTKPPAGAPDVAKGEPGAATVDPEAADPREDSGDPDAPADAAAPQLRERPAPVPVDGRDAAMQAVVRGNPGGAIAALEKHLKDKPGDVDARIALARAHLAGGAIDDAKKVLEDAKGKPLDVEIVQVRVALARMRGDLAGAMKLLDEAQRKHPDALPLVGDRIALLVDTGHRDDPKTTALIDQMYDAYDAGKAKTTAELLAVAIAAYTRGGKGGFHDANMVLEAAETLDPVDAGTWVGDRVRLLRGSIFLEKYAADEAATTFEMLLARDPWHVDALAGMAMVNVESLRFAAAARAATEALMVDPHHADAHAALARIALIEGRHDELRAHTSGEALKRNPGHARSLAVVAAEAIANGDRKAYAIARDRVLADNPKAGGFFRDLSDILGFLHLYPEADEVLREGAKLSPNDPYVQSALGLNLLRLGDEALGREALDRAWKRDPFNERTRNTLDLYEDRLDKHYTVETKGDLTVRLPTEDREFVQPILLASAERSKKALDGFYKIDAGKLRLEFFASPEEFSVRTIGVPSLGAVAVCFGPVITFIGPYHGHVNLDLVMRHELAHVYAIRRSKGRVPRWFTEGLSEWESEQADPAWARESAALLTAAKKQGKLRKLSELELAFIRAESPMMMEAAYATAAYAIRYLAATYGREKLIAILDGYAEGKHTDVLFAKHFGKPLETVEREFEAWFSAQLAAKLSGWSPDGAKPDDERSKLWASAQEQVEAKDNAAAIRTLESLAAKKGDGFSVRMALAELVMDGKSPAAAKRHLEAAMKFMTESIEPHVRLAKLARDAGDIAEEKKVLRAALAIDADSLDPAARFLMLALVTDDADAIALGQARVAALAPLHPIALAARAIALSKSGKAADAKAHVARADAALKNTQGRGPADTLVVVALAHRATGDKAGADAMVKQLGKADIPAAARKKLAG